MLLRVQKCAVDSNWRVARTGNLNKEGVGEEPPSPPNCLLLLPVLRMCEKLNGTGKLMQKSKFISYICSHILRLSKASCA